MEKFIGKLLYIWARLQEPSTHATLTALMMSAGMMFSSFCVIPYITLYYQGNGILTAAQLPLVYLCGGLATLFTSRWVGGLADRIGKLRMLRRMILVSMVPIMVTTLLQPQ